MLVCQKGNRTEGVLGGTFSWYAVLETCLAQGMPRDALNVMDAAWEAKEKAEKAKQN